MFMAFILNCALKANILNAGKTVCAVTVVVCLICYYTYFNVRFQQIMAYLMLMKCNKLTPKYQHFSLEFGIFLILL